MPAGVVEFKQFFYQKTEAWSDNLAQFIKDPSTPTERGDVD
jgi:hypothetical protein